MNEKDEKSSHLHEKMMLELLKAELETQVKTLSEGLLSYQRSKKDLKLLEPLMRAAHSIKGAVKVFNFDPLVQLAHALEDTFITAKEKIIDFDEDRIEMIFRALDLIGSFVDVSTEEFPHKLAEQQKQILQITDEIKKFAASFPPKDTHVLQPQEKTEQISEKKPRDTDPERMLRLTPQTINRLMGLAAESMVETRSLQPFCNSLLRLKLTFNQLILQLDHLKNSLGNTFFDKNVHFHFQSLAQSMHAYQNELSDRLADLEMFINRHTHLTDRLYNEVIESRMRPFADGIEAFPRMVWETARYLKKKARLEIHGKSTLVDRDILEKLEVPLGHLLRNAIDHGIETPEVRVAAGKLPEGVIQLTASHHVGMLAISVSDDGRGIDMDALKKKIVEKKLATEDMISKMTEQQVLDFIFMSGFSTSRRVTELSGRGIGLDIVQNMLKQVSGTLRIENRPGKGVSFHLQLPLTLSIIRALIVKIDKGLFAFPLTRIQQTLVLSTDNIEQVENREYFNYFGSNVGLIPATEILNLGEFCIASSLLPIVILRHLSNDYGIIVDQFLGEKELVLQDIESQLGKIPCISTGSVLENGDPVLIIDVDEMVEAINLFFNSGRTLPKLRGLNSH